VKIDLSATESARNLAVSEVSENKELILQDFAVFAEATDVFRCALAMSGLISEYSEITKSVGQLPSFEESASIEEHAEKERAAAIPIAKNLKISTFRIKSSLKTRPIHRP
jgi:hypothetical protein